MNTNTIMYPTQVNCCIDKNTLMASRSYPPVISNACEYVQIPSESNMCALNPPLNQFITENNDCYRQMCNSPFLNTLRADERYDHYSIQRVEKYCPFVDNDCRKWRQARCSEGSLPIFNTYQQGVDIGILSVQPGSLVVIPLLPQCTIQTDMPFACDSQKRINHCMCDVNISKSCVISPPIDMEFGIFSSPLPLQLSEVNSENNEIFNDSLNPFDVLGSNDPLTKLSFEELKIRNHKEFVRSELIESLGLSKEKMYYELLKPYKHRRIQSFDHKIQTHKYVYICTYENCDKEFTKGWNILDHVRMHENIKPYQCDGCERAFTQKCNLTKHYRRHLITRLRDRKRFFCQVCRKGFTERYNLKAHAKKHTQRGERTIETL